MSASIPGLRGLPPATVLRRAVESFMRDDMATYAGSLAFHTLLALFPFLAFLLGLLSLLDVEVLFDSLVAYASTVLPRDGLRQVLAVVEELRGGNEGLVSIGMLGAVWAASGGIRSTMNGLNRAYSVAEARPALKRYWLSIAYTIALAVLLTAATGLMFIGPQAAGWAAERVGLGGGFTAVWGIMRIPVAIVLLMAAASAVYYFAPNLPDRIRFVTPGSTFVVLLWIAVSYAFRLYLDNFSRYGVLYGSLGTVVVLLLYFYLSAAVLLFGAEINAVIRREGSGAGPLASADAGRRRISAVVEERG